MEDQSLKQDYTLEVIRSQNRVVLAKTLLYQLDVWTIGVTIKQYDLQVKEAAYVRLIWMIKIRTIRYITCCSDGDIDNACITRYIFIKSAVE